MSAVFAIGDIHGECELLQELVAALPLGREDELVFLGDYVDRGPDPKGVVDFLLGLANERRCTFLMGNHESMFLDFLGWEHPAYFGGDAFLANGGDRTLASYGYFDAERELPEGFRLPDAHEAFYQKLVLHHRHERWVFVHAGIGRAQLRASDPARALADASPADLLWDRSCIEQPHELVLGDEPCTVIFGHTPSSDLRVRWHRPYGIGIDTGAVYGGPLTAIRLPDEKIFQI
jgi:serine/threonine protein phosphatase 1